MRESDHEIELVNNILEQILEVRMKVMKEILFALLLNG